MRAFARAQTGVGQTNTRHNAPVVLFGSEGGGAGVLTASPLAFAKALAYLVTSPRPAPPYAHAASSLSGELYAPFHRGRGGPGGWIILNEPELHLHGDVLVPDIAGWRRERMSTLPSGSAFELAPDWICEVL